MTSSRSKDLIRAALGILLVSAILTLIGKHRSSNVAISPITFQELDRQVRNRSSPDEVKQCSRRLQGTRVRWTGTVTSVEQGKTVYIATNVFPTNVQFDVRSDTASALHKGESVTFAGTIEDVSDTETAPPMFHTYVILNNVDVQRTQK